MKPRIFRSRDQGKRSWQPVLTLWIRLLRRKSARLLTPYRFGSISRRILVLNLIAVVVLVGTILYFSQSRLSLTKSRIESITTQAEIIANAISQVGTKETEFGDDGGWASNQYGFRINPELIVPMLRDLVGPTKTRARIFDAQGNLLADSQQLYARVQPVQNESKDNVDTLGELWLAVKRRFFEPDLPTYEDFGNDGLKYDEVRIALSGSPLNILRLTGNGETVASVAIPIQRRKVVLGALMLTAQGGDIDEAIAAERWRVLYMALLVIIVSGLLSWLLAGTIAGPIHRLATGAERVRRNIKMREKIPDYSHRSDEIGYLSRAFRDMTQALYLRLDAIESFAADVSHELKNPLTSLRNAAGMLAIVKKEEDKKKLLDIIQHDVRRLDRLITDISDASRLDAELARETAKPVNVANMLTALCEITREARASNGLNITLDIQGYDAQNARETTDYIVNGHDSRLSQVVINLLENAMSFSPHGGNIVVSAKRLAKEKQIEITVEDEGPGIRPENLEKIFERFYTDRPEHEAFGQNSGLGLNISQQIVKAHLGSIWAENKPTLPTSQNKDGLANGVNGTPTINEQDGIFACGRRERCSGGARFVIRLPMADTTRHERRQ